MRQDKQGGEGTVVVLDVWTPDVMGALGIYDGRGIDPRLSGRSGDRRSCRSWGGGYG